MPEGHTIHRLARRHRDAIVGERLHVSSPQGRFSAGADRLDGQRLDDVRAVGKHLFYEWERGDLLHVHLGLFGRFRLHRTDPPLPTDGTRLAMEGGDVTVYLSGPTACELIEPSEETAIRDRLGPDPISQPGEVDRFAAALGRRRIPIAAAVLDQKVVAGIGNVYRSELLFRQGIDPRVPANELDDDAMRDLWDDTVAQLRAGERSGRIITVDPADVGARRRSDLRGERRRYVYKRAGESCWRCGETVVADEIGGRTAFWCPACQRA